MDDTVIRRIACENAEGVLIDVYHTCSVEPVASRKWLEGFQPTPWTCPGCGEHVAWGDEVLTYEFRVECPTRVVGSTNHAPKDKQSRAPDKPRLAHWRFFLVCILAAFAGGGIGALIVSAMY